MLCFQTKHFSPLRTGPWHCTSPAQLREPMNNPAINGTASYIVQAPRVIVRRHHHVRGDPRSIRAPSINGPRLSRPAATSQSCPGPSCPGFPVHSAVPTCGYTIEPSRSAVVLVSRLHRSPPSRRAASFACDPCDLQLHHRAVPVEGLSRLVAVPAAAVPTCSYITELSRSQLSRGEDKDCPLALGEELYCLSPCPRRGARSPPAGASGWSTLPTSADDKKPGLRCLI